MNYLAHAYLSHQQEGLLIGNFIADHLKGNKLDHFSNEIQKGIILHRQIDTFTDTHDLFKQCKRLFYKDFEKFSGVLVDMYFDHLLAKHFQEYSPFTLQSFSTKAYTIYQNNIVLLPPTSQQFLGYVIKNNIYEAYSKIEGIEKVLYHLSQRIKHPINLHESISVFKENEDAFHANFNIFFMDITEHFKSPYK